jgi:phytoene dehydrogenase-like protein
MQRIATVIGSGPNGLAGAITLAQAGLDVDVREAAPEFGGGARSAEVTLPGFVHDLGSAVHPMAVSSPFFSKLPLGDHGLNWIWSPAAVAHPFDDGTAITLERSVSETTAQLGEDAEAYSKLFDPLVRNWPTLAPEVLRPLGIPAHPILMARFGVRAVLPATVLTLSSFRAMRARALFAGLAAHSVLPLESPLSSAFGFILGVTGHSVGWPIPRGGAQSITNALAGILKSLGGRITADARVTSLGDLSRRDAILCDVTPRQFMGLANGRLPSRFECALNRFQYGPGIFKMDWALREPIPWKAKECFRAATVHLGGTLEEIAASERTAWRGQPPDSPFVLLAQPTLFDSTRAPAGNHTAWAYCHVPNGWPGSALAQIEAQIERFAPGFRDCILARRPWSSVEMQQCNPNLIGGDLNGGAPTLKQFVLRPTWRRYATPLKGVYICSSSTPPGGGVHGMCGHYAARWALQYLSKC